MDTTAGASAVPSESTQTTKRPRKSKSAAKDAETQTAVATSNKDAETAEKISDDAPKKHRRASRKTAPKADVETASSDTLSPGLPQAPEDPAATDALAATEAQEPAPKLTRKRGTRRPGTDTTDTETTASLPAESTDDDIPEPQALQNSAPPTAENARSLFVIEHIEPTDALPRLTRKKGLRRQKSESPQPVEHSDVFVPRTLPAEPARPETEQKKLLYPHIFKDFFLNSSDPGRSLPARPHGRKIPHAVHVAYRQRMAIPPHNRPEFRPEFLRHLPTAVPLDTPLTIERIQALAALLQQKPELLTRTVYNAPMNLHAAIYRGRPAPEPAPAPTPDTDEIEAEETTDLALEAIFDIFTPEIVPFIANTDDPRQLAYLHITNHVSRITALLGDWARALPYIDRGAFGGPESKPLYICFIDRFHEILKVDFEAARAQNVILRDNELRERFSLDDIDLLLLWILAGLELDPTFKSALRANWDQPTVVYMSAGTIMRFVCGTQAERIHVLSRLSPSSPMVNAGLIRIASNNTPVQPLYYELVVAEQIIKLFSGIRSLSAAATQYAELQFPHFSEDTFLDPSHQKTIDIIRNYLERPLPNQQPNLERENLNFIPSLAFLVEGLPGSGRTTFIKIAASKLSRPFILIQGSQLNGLHPSDCEEYLRSVFIDAMLMNAIVCIRDVGPLLIEDRSATILARQLSLRPVICALCVELAVKTVPAIDPYITFKAKMDANLKDNAAAFWTQHLHLPHLNASDVDVRALSQRLALQPIQIQKATKLAYYQTEAGETDIPVSNRTLERAAAVQVIKNIGNLAFVTDPEVDLSDVIVSDDIMERIKKIIGSAQNRRRVLYEWGLSKRIRRGTGVIALFDGDPGTGKTHSAEAIAHELGLSLMRINIANMVDKYIGETEKNLTTIFEQARPDMQLLLFDEADSLFTKRTSNVSKSNDRYSNMSVNVLLQLVERYEGVSILTTNLKNAIDPAFERRITYKIYFPMPKKPERERLWRYMCPPEIVTAEPIDYEWLSELEMSGGEIKNAVLTAAFTAATNGVLLSSEILYDAGVSEASAAGRVMRRYEEGNDYLN